MANKIKRGDTAYVDITAIQPSGDPYDLDDVDMWFSVKRSLSDADEDALIFKTLIDGINIVVAAEGTAVVQIDPIDTEDLEVPIMGAYWDVQVKDDMGNVFTIDSGTLSILADVTRTSS